MHSVIETLKAWQLHPFVDHFTVALILVGIITDLVANLFSTRLWLRYMALTLMIVGALAAGASNITGGWEADRVWDAVTGPGKQVLERHARIGDILPWVFGALALWRIGVQFIGAIAEFRAIYLLVAVLAGVAILYQGHLGSEMVYDYGIGTARMTMAPVAMPSPSPVASADGNTAAVAPLPSSLPTSTSTPAPAVSAGTVAAPTPAMGSTPNPGPSPSSSPAATASAGTGTPINPPSVKAGTPGSSEPQNL